MAVGDPQETEFMKQYMKALKFEYEHASTPVAKQQAASKADTVRQNAKNMGIDLSAYGPGIQLVNTPGGNTINWNILSTVGKAWAGLNPTDDVSKWKQSVGTGLVSNLSGYQADFASFADSAAYDTIGAKSKMAQPTMWQAPGTGAVNPVISGSNVGEVVTVPDVVTVPEVPDTTPTVGQVADTVRGGARSSGAQAVTTPATYTNPEDSDPDVLDAVNGMATDESMLAAFLKDNPDVNADNTQWDVPTVNRFKTWADLYVEKVSTEGVIAQGEKYDPTKDPLWSAYEPLLIARDNMTKRSLKTALDLKINAIEGEAADVKANYTFQIAEIQNAMNMANWATGQQLAASGVIMVGQLSQALQANEAQGINKIWLSVQERTNGLDKLARDINILRQDYADQGTLIDQKTILEIATNRLELIQGNSKEVQAAKLALLGINARIAAANIAAPGTQKATEAGIVAANEQVDFERAATMGQLDVNGVYMTQDKTTGKWTFKTHLTPEQDIAQKRFVLDNFIQRQAIQLDWKAANLETRKQDFYEWATKAGLNMDKKQLDLAWAELGGAMTRAGWKKDASGNYTYTGEGQTTTGGAGGNGTGGAAGSYMSDEAGFAADKVITANAADFGTNNYQQAVLRIGLGSGGLLADDSAFLMALTGAPKSKVPAWWAAMSGNTPFGGMSGVLTSADEASVAHLADITDEKSPARALELYVAWKIKHPPTGTTPGSNASASAIASYCKDFGAALGYSPADISTAANWLLTNIGKLTGGTP